MMIVVYIIISIIILFILAVLVNTWVMKNSRPWRKIHYKAMRLYSGALGTEMSISESEKREFDIINTYRLLLASFGYKSSQMIFTNMISRNLPGNVVFSAHQYMDSVGKNKNLSSDEIDATLESLFYKIQQSSERYLQVRLLISEIIEDKYGRSHRNEYLFFVLTGNAT